MDNKDKVMLEYLLSCPAINERSLFFNFAEGKDETNHFVTQATDINRQKPFVDGSIAKVYSFSIVTYKSLGTQAVDKENVGSDENLDELAEVQSLIDWITEQRDNSNYPDFGESINIDDMYCTTDKPVLLGVFQDTLGTPTARYSMTIMVEYIDNSKMIWK